MNSSITSQRISGYSPFSESFLETQRSLDAGLRPWKLAVHELIVKIKQEVMAR
jgi:hypothetical protein